jgi:hypothetical protein
MRISSNGRWKNGVLNSTAATMRLTWVTQQGGHLNGGFTKLISPLYFYGVIRYYKSNAPVKINQRFLYRSCNSFINAITFFKVLYNKPVLWSLSFSPTDRIHSSILSQIQTTYLFSTSLWCLLRLLDWLCNLTLGVSLISSNESSRRPLHPSQNFCFTTKH